MNFDEYYEIPQHLMLPPPDQDSSFEIGELTNRKRKGEHHFKRRIEGSSVRY